MSDKKFFSGLTDGMMKRNYNRGVDRQQTNFYWPDETDMEQVPPPRQRIRNRSSSNASLISQSQVSSDNEVSRRRRSQQNESKIEFYDMVDVGTDNESVYSRTPDATKQKKLETLKSGIEFYDYVDTRVPKDEVVAKRRNESFTMRNLEPSVIENKVLVTTEKEPQKEEEPLKRQNGKDLQSEKNLAQIVQDLSLNGEAKNGFPKNTTKTEALRKKVPQYIESSASESDEDDRYSRGRNQVAEDRRYLPPPSRYPSSQCSSRSRPRRQSTEYYDFDDDEYDRRYDARLRYRKPQNIPPRMARRRDFYPDLSDEDLYDDVDNYRRSGEYLRQRAYPPPDRYASRSSRISDGESYRRNRKNGYTSEIDFQRDNLPPVRKPSPQNQSNIETEDKFQSEVVQRSPEPRMPSARPPVKPLSRTMSINEAKQRHHVNLRSNIFHNDPEYNQIVEQKKPLSVRDFAARQRVGVGLPDI